MPAFAGMTVLVYFYSCATAPFEGMTLNEFTELIKLAQMLRFPLKN